MADTDKLAWPLTPAMIRQWLSTRGLSDTSDALVDDVISSVVPFVQRSRDEFWFIPAATPDDPTPVREYRPDVEVMQAARMLVARVLRRRASPGGIESFGDGAAAGVQYVARFDPEIERALRLGAYSLPRIG